jgi:hypothetical protein
MDDENNEYEDEYFDGAVDFQEGDDGRIYRLDRTEKDEFEEEDITISDAHVYENNDKSEDDLFNEGEDQRNGKDTDKDNDNDIDEELIDFNDGKNQKIELINNKISELAENFENREITFNEYNKSLIDLQHQIAKLKLDIFETSHNVQDNTKLVQEIDLMFSKLGAQKNTGRLASETISNTLDIIFQKYAGIIDKQIFISNKVNTKIGEIVYKELEPDFKSHIQSYFVKKEKGNLSIDDCFDYVNYKINGLLDILNRDFKYDIFYPNFSLDLNMKQVELHDKLNTIISNPDIDEDDNRLINNLPEIIDNFINEKIAEYQNKQDSVFKKKDSVEVRKLIKQLQELTVIIDGVIYKKFDENEILNDFTTQPLTYIIEKYSDYLYSDYFDWVPKKESYVYQAPKYNKNKLSLTDLKKLEEKYASEYKLRTVLNKIPKDILCNCIATCFDPDFINSYNIVMSTEDTFINNLYNNTIDLIRCSRFYPEDIEAFATEFGLSADDLFINKNQSHQQHEFKYNVGDVVYVDRNKRDSVFNAQKRGTFKNTRPMQLKGTVVKLDLANNKVSVKIDESTVEQVYSINEVTSYLKPKQHIQMYKIIDSNAYNPTNDLKNIPNYHIKKWIDQILGPKDYSVYENLNDLYNEAYDKYVNYNDEQKKLIDSNLQELPKSLKKQFINGIPIKDPLVYKFPPVIPNDDDEFDKFRKYIENLDTYIKELSPETNPYVTTGIPINNKLRTLIDIKSFNSLGEAIRSIRPGEYFKLKNTGDFDNLVLKNLTDKQKVQIQKFLLTEEQIRVFNDSFYKTQEEIEYNDKHSSKINPKIAMISKLREVKNNDEYIQKIKELDKTIQIQSINGNEVVCGNTVLTKEKLEQIILNKINTSKNIQQVEIKRTPLVPSIEWAITFNPTFKLLELNENVKGSWIVNSHPIKYRIKIINNFDSFYTGWLINPIEMINTQKKIEYKYKYPIIITDFIEFLKIYRHNLYVRYENIRQNELLNFEQFNLGSELFRKIEHISSYLKKIGKDDDLVVELIKQTDANEYVRQSQRLEILERLRIIDPIQSEEILKKCANTIEEVTYNQFKNIRTNTFKKNVENVERLNTRITYHFDLMKKFTKNRLTWLSEDGTIDTYVSSLIFNNNGNYISYITIIAIALFNVANKNNFFIHFVKDDSVVKEIIEHDLTKTEIGRAFAIESLVDILKWNPDTFVLNILLNENTNAYDEMWKTINAKVQVYEPIDVDVLAVYETNSRKKISKIKKEIAMLEIVKLHKWEKAKTQINSIEEENRYKFLADIRNSIRPVNNITANIRLYTLSQLDMVMHNYGMTKKPEPGHTETLENIEEVCYIISSSESDYMTVYSTLISDKNFINMAYNNIDKFELIDYIANLREQVSKNSSLVNIIKSKQYVIKEMIEQNIPIKNEYIENIDELQKIARKNTIINSITNSYFDKLTQKDLQEIQTRPLQEIAYLADNLYKEPVFMTHLPLSYGFEGIHVIPIGHRGGYLVAGNFPLDNDEYSIKSYRYKSDDKVQTRLEYIVTNIIGINLKEEFKVQEYIPSIFSQVTKYELSLFEIVSSIVQNRIYIKLYENKILNYNQVAECILSEFNMKESINKFCTENNYNKKSTTNREVIIKLFGVEKIERSEGTYVPISLVDNSIEVSIIRDDNQEIIRKIYYSDLQTYPIPIGYTDDKFPIYSSSQKSKLAELIRGGYLNPWYKTYININEVDGDIEFSGSVPFRIKEVEFEDVDIKVNTFENNEKKVKNIKVRKENFSNIQESNYYVEQVYKEPMHGFPIVTRIGIYPKQKNNDIHFAKDFIFPIPIRYDRVSGEGIEVPPEDALKLKRLIPSLGEGIKIIPSLSENVERIPVYSRKQTKYLLDLINLNPILKEGVVVTDLGNDTYSFDKTNLAVELPFIIDETSDSIDTSNYYKIIYVSLKTTNGGKFNLQMPVGCTSQEKYNKLHKIVLPPTIFEVKEEPFKIKYFRSEYPSQSEVDEFKINSQQTTLKIHKNDVRNKSGYAAIDDRVLAYKNKYDPDDVWSWSPLTDYKAGAENDNALWVAEKNRQMTYLTEWLRKVGSTSSAFIAAKNESTRILQYFRLNLPSQRTNNKRVYKKNNFSLYIKDVLKAWNKFKKEKLIKEAKRINFYSPDMDRMNERDLLVKMKTKLKESANNQGQTISKIIGTYLSDNIDQSYKVFLQKEKIANCSYYINHFIEVGILKINRDALKLIKNPHMIFKKYNRFDLAFDTTKTIDNDGNIYQNVQLDRIAKYSTYINEQRKIEIFNETVYEIINNMTYTSYLFNQEIVQYINDVSKMLGLSKVDRDNLITKYPVLIFIAKLFINKQPITLWNIMLYSYESMFTDSAYKLNTVVISIFDVIGYLGDSYYQNAVYKKGIVYKSSSTGYTGEVSYLHPNYQFKQILSNDVTFENNDGMVSKLSSNPYITLFREKRDSSPIIELLVVGEDLHQNLYEVSSAEARRFALLYEVDIDEIDPCFSIANPLTQAKNRNIMIDKIDVIKYLQKGGKSWTLLEMSDAELTARSIVIRDKQKIINFYKEALRNHYNSKKNIDKKELNSIILQRYVDMIDEKISTNKFNKSTLSKYITDMNIELDFLDTNWTKKIDQLEFEFLRKFCMIYKETCGYMNRLKKEKNELHKVLKLNSNKNDAISKEIETRLFNNELNTRNYIIQNSKYLEFYKNCEKISRELVYTKIDKLSKNKINTIKQSVDA